MRLYLAQASARSSRRLARHATSGSNQLLGPNTGPATNGLRRLSAWLMVLWTSIVSTVDFIGVLLDVAGRCGRVISEPDGVHVFRTVKPGAYPFQFLAAGVHPSPEPTQVPRRTREQTEQERPPFGKLSHGCLRALLRFKRVCVAGNRLYSTDLEQHYADIKKHLFAIMELTDNNSV